MTNFVGCKILFALLLVCLLTTTLTASDYVLLSDYGSSARFIGLGGIEAGENSAAALFENPAGLNKLTGLSLYAFQASFLNGEFPLTYLATAIPSSIGTFALGFGELKASNINFTTVDNNNEYAVDHTFSAKNAVYSLGYQKSLSPNFSFGSSVTYYLQDFSSASGKGFNADLGILFETENTVISLHGKNVIPFLKVDYSNGQSESLPLQMILSGQRKFGDFTAFGQLKMQSLGLRYLKSIALQYSPSLFFHRISFTSAYKEIYVVNQSHNNVALGLNLDLNPLGFSVAYEHSDYIEMDSQLYFSSHLNF